MSKKILLAAVCAVFLNSACFEFLQKGKTSPTGYTVDFLGGTWTSVASETSILDTCTDFKWTVTETSGNTGAGTFTATCLQTLQVSGKASGILAGETVTWSATATGTSPGFPDCAMTLSGAAILEGDQIRIPYTGTTCIGPVAGTEILKKT
jgi:hypothetical protein